MIGIMDKQNPEKQVTHEEAFAAIGRMIFGSELRYQLEVLSKYVRQQEKLDQE